jgi:hypothetical protein
MFDQADDSGAKLKFVNLIATWRVVMVALRDCLAVVLSNSHVGGK